MDKTKLLKIGAVAVLVVTVITGLVIIDARQQAKIKALHKEYLESITSDDDVIPKTDDRLTGQEGNTDQVAQENLPKEDASISGTQALEEPEVKFSDVDFNRQDLPDADNPSDAETCGTDKEIKVFFTNTQILDASSLPLSVHGILAEGAQDFLDAEGYMDVTTLDILQEGFIDDESQVTFLCGISGYYNILQTTWLKQEGMLRFSITELYLPENQELSE